MDEVGTEADRYSETQRLTFVVGRKDVREEIGRNLDQGFREETLEGRNPREQPAVGVLNPRTVARDSGKGRNPGTAACQAGPALRRRVYRQCETVCGFFQAETFGLPFQRRKLRRVNPKSAAGAK